jgi:hypothetical protein
MGSELTGVESQLWREVELFVQIATKGELSVFFVTELQPERFVAVYRRPRNVLQAGPGETSGSFFDSYE